MGVASSKWGRVAGNDGISFYPVALGIKGELDPGQGGLELLTISKINQIISTVKIANHYIFDSISIMNIELETLYFLLLFSL